MRWTKGPQQKAGPCCSFLMKGGGWKGSLSIACSVPQASLCRHTAGGLHSATTLKKPILKQSQRQTLTLETGTCFLTPGSPLCSPVLWGRMFEPVSQPALVTFKPTRGQKVCSLSASSKRAPFVTFFSPPIHTHTFYNCSFSFRAIDVWITFSLVTASSFSSVVSCILILRQTD